MDEITDFDLLFLSWEGRWICVTILTSLLWMKLIIGFCSHVWLRKPISCEDSVTPTQRSLVKEDHEFGQLKGERTKQSRSKKDTCSTWVLAQSHLRSCNSRNSERSWQSKWQMWPIEFVGSTAMCRRPESARRESADPDMYRNLTEDGLSGVCKSPEGDFHIKLRSNGVQKCKCKCSGLIDAIIIHHLTPQHPLMSRKAEPRKQCSCGGSGQRQGKWHKI